jgi:hypothetical protein
LVREAAVHEASADSDPLVIDVGKNGAELARS